VLLLLPSALEETLTSVDLRARPGLRLGRGRWLVPPWVAPALLVCALVLIPWTALLFLTLPPHYVANHWRLAWGGFDIGLGIALAATALTVARRSPFAEVTATITGTLLCCDAWFDVLTSRGVSDVAQAAASAVFVELPLAGLCFWMARNLAHAVEIARPFLQAAGFRISENRLVPPPRAAPKR
jgi:sterol desaturase/sphingolipid hydroxylase (fatty acid hydroxylase superfamily)